MALIKQRPVLWRPAGATDSFDAGGSFVGAMTYLGNLIPSRSTANLWRCRPASLLLSTFPTYNLPREVTCARMFGNRVYGFLSSSDFPGKDVPFSYNPATDNFARIVGMSADNLPTTQPTTGDWTPPTVTQVGSRIVFTHPGFPGGTTNAPFFNRFFANVTSGSPTLTGIINAHQTIASGMQIFGPGIPAGATVTDFAFTPVNTTASGTSGTPTLTVASAAGLVIGMNALGAGIPAFTIVNNIVGTTVTLSQNLTVTLPAGTQVSFTHLVVTMSANATATATQSSTSFASSMANCFGWIDLGGFTNTVFGNTLAGLPAITGFPAVAGLQPGMTVTGPNIAAGTTIRGYANTFGSVTATWASGSSTITLDERPGDNFFVDTGQIISATGIPAFTTILAVSGLVLTISSLTTAAGTNQTVQMAGSIIVLSQPATGSALNSTLTIAGGTTAAPQWGAGDTSGIGLSTVPVFARQFTGRCYFGINPARTLGGVAASDVGLPCQITSPAQIIFFEDGIAVTAAEGLGLSNQLGGVVASLIVFQGAANIRQITGDFALGNWAENSLQVATGTLAPNTVTSSPYGLLFVAPDGLRSISFTGAVSPVIGDNGQGYVMPFLCVEFPSRMVAAYNENVYRVSVTWQPPITLQAIWGAADRSDEFWFHPSLQRWSGPHSFPFRIICPWPQKASFVGQGLLNALGTLWRGDVLEGPTNTYIENSIALQWFAQTALMPDDIPQMANSIAESSVFLSAHAGDTITVIAVDDAGVVMDTAIITMTTPPQMRLYAIPWSTPLVFRQMFVRFFGISANRVLFGPINFRYQELGYQITAPP